MGYLRALCDGLLVFMTGMLILLNKCVAHNNLTDKMKTTKNHLTHETNQVS